MHFVNQCPLLMNAKPLTHKSNYIILQGSMFHECISWEKKSMFLCAPLIKNDISVYWILYLSITINAKSEKEMHISRIQIYFSSSSGKPTYSSVSKSDRNNLLTSLTVSIEILNECPLLIQSLKTLRCQFRIRLYSIDNSIF